MFKHKAYPHLGLYECTNLLIVAMFYIHIHTYLCIDILGNCEIVLISPCNSGGAVNIIFFNAPYGYLIFI